MRVGGDHSDAALPVYEIMRRRCVATRENLELTEAEESTLESIETALDSMIGARVTRSKLQNSE